ncbi:hypothetical protein C7451_106249 [Blastomonas natatoria]|uniref:Uncharacterized protein n=1 Tax=Blastomonas natatoria TaxID=34015 RepID=A0A2V3V2W2_9SPHN|nr:hypothetical protein [Blastomonas natatoria]PXW76083.1 hypothetical protein C7451_106249 [Blastomonas natatoria]
MSSEISRNVFLSILAVDSYNRGYGQGILGLSPSGNIGNATIEFQSRVSPESGEVGAGFYAIAYDMTGVAGFSAGQTVIAYRGTDANLADRCGTGKDGCNGASYL